MMDTARPVLLLGASGQLGCDLARAVAGPRLVALTRRDLDVTDAAAVEDTVARTAPTVVLNATAYNRVDDAETDPRPAFAVNAVAVHHLAQVCARVGARLVHFSTDYVFGASGDGPFAEDAPPAPLNAYGVSKLTGEHLARAASPRHLVIRTSGLYGVAGSRAKGGNFVETMLRLARDGKPLRVVDDQATSPTYTADLADAVRALLAADPPGGVYHVTNSGACAWFRVAGTIFRLAGLGRDLSATRRAAFGGRARRPANSILLDTRLRPVGLAPLRPWPDALSAYLQARGR